MKRYIKYNKASGKIISSGMCPDTMFALQVRNDPEAELLEGEITNENYIVDGVAVYIPPPPPTQEELDREALAMDRRLFIGKLIDVLFIIESRLRVLEGKPEITKEQLRDWLRSNL